MTESNIIESIAEEIKAKFDSVDGSGNQKHIVTLYAFNGVGKTRISNEFTLLNNEDEETDEVEYKVLCYSAFLEDLFVWDNENNILFFQKNSWEAKLIQDEGLNIKIIDNFKNFLNTKIEPSFDLTEGKITFDIPSGDDDSLTGIKISRSEESIFIWSVFYTILETAINELNESEDDRSTDIFNDLEYIIIDDPVSSIDDTRIINLALEIIKLIKSYNSDELKFLITTHHPLFYNVLFNSIKSNKRHSCILQKTSSGLELKGQDDSPFGYHLLVKEEIKNAIDSGDIQKYHFNLFRGLLEKTVNFLGLENFRDCITEDGKTEFIRLLNLYSHNRLSDMEYKEVTDEDKELFKEKFNDFIENFKYN